MKMIRQHIKSLIVSGRRLVVAAASILAVASANALGASLFTTNNATADSALPGWPASNTYDGNASTSWSSNSHTTSNATEGFYYWWAEGIQTTNFIKLLPRYSGNNSLCFPTDFQVWYSSGPQWIQVASFKGFSAPSGGDWVTIPLPGNYSANGIAIVATNLSTDGGPGYYFQLAEVKAGYDSAFNASRFDPGYNHSGYDVRRYGAVGDGNHDDHDAIQAAINAAQSAGGGIVFLSAGNYLVGSTVRISSNNVEIRGVGQATRIFTNWPAGAVISIGDPTNYLNCIHNGVFDLFVDRSVAPNPDYTNSPSYGIQILRARNTTIEHVNVWNAAYGVAAGIKGGTGIPTDRVRIMECWFTWGKILDAAIIFYQMADGLVEHTFVEPANRGIVMSDGSNGIFIQDTEVINGQNFNYGIVSEGSGYARHVIGCTVENAVQNEVYIGGTSYVLPSELADGCLIWLVDGHHRGHT